MNIIELLVDPLTKEKLSIKEADNSISNLSVDQFEGKLIDGIPVVLPKGEDSKATSLHQKSESNFNYIDHYIKDAEAFDYFEEAAEITENERDRLNQLLIQKIDRSAEKILDVGCGNGWLSRHVQNDNNQVTSLDISLINVKKVLQQTPHANHSGLVADVYNLPLKENSFDTIVASEIIEHVYDPKEFIRCLLKVLKPNGKLLISTPYNEQIPLHLCVHCNKPTPENAHLHSFNEKNVRQIVPKSVKGLSVTTSSNKHLLKLRIYLLMKRFPFSIWNFVDRLAIKILKGPTRLIFEITK